MNVWLLPSNIKLVSQTSKETPLQWLEEISQLNHPKINSYDDTSLCGV